ncbi:G-patch domain-containing protein [Balamuthia mandrillaris]
MEGEREADRRAGLGYPPYSRYNAGKDKGKEREENNKDEELLGDDDVWRLPLNHTPSGYLDFDKLEQASMDKALDEDNIGFRLLQKMGWKAGQGLGKEGSGIVAPIRVDIKEDFLGLGKKEQEETYATEATAKRKTLESEKEETEELKRRREEKVEKEHSIKQEVTEILDVFHCKLCNKQYTNVAQYDAHLSSYDHHHKKVPPLSLSLSRLVSYRSRNSVWKKHASQTTLPRHKWPRTSEERKGESERGWKNCTQLLLPA